MKQITARIIEDTIQEEFMNDGEWWDYVNSLEQSDWSDYDEHPWAWYMERDKCKHEGWTLVIVSRDHKDVTGIYYLKSLGAKFKHSKNEFLIKEQEHAIMVALKYA